jgi:hypothetical protein
MPLKATPADKSVVKNVLVTKIVLVAKNALATKIVPVAKTKLLAPTLPKLPRSLKMDALKANFVLNANTAQPAMTVVHVAHVPKANVVSPVMNSVVNLVVNSVVNLAVNAVSLAANNLVANVAKVVPSAHASKLSPSSSLSKSLQAFGQASPASLLHSGASLSALSLFLNNAKEMVLVVMDIAKMVAVTNVATDNAVVVDHVAPAVAVLAVADLAPTKAN